MALVYCLHILALALSLNYTPLRTDTIDIPCNLHKLELGENVLSDYFFAFSGISSTKSM